MFNWIKKKQDKPEKPCGSVSKTIPPDGVIVISYNVPMQSYFSKEHRLIVEYMEPVYEEESLEREKECTTALWLCTGHDLGSERIYGTRDIWNIPRGVSVVLYDKTIWNGEYSLACALEAHEAVWTYFRAGGRNKAEIENIMELEG